MLPKLEAGRRARPARRQPGLIRTGEHRRTAEPTPCGWPDSIPRPAATGGAPAREPRSRARTSVSKRGAARPEQWSRVMTMPATSDGAGSDRRRRGVPRGDRRASGCSATWTSCASRASAAHPRARPGLPAGRRVRSRRDLRAAGLEHVEVSETGGHPIVYADWLHAAGRADGPRLRPLRRPAGRSARRCGRPPPFEPIVRDGRVLARGASDDKSNISIALAGGRGAPGRRAGRSR